MLLDINEGARDNTVLTVKIPVKANAAWALPDLVDTKNVAIEYTK